MRSTNRWYDVYLALDGSGGPYLLCIHAHTEIYIHDNNIAYTAHREVETCGLPFMRHAVRTRAIEGGGFTAPGARAAGGKGGKGGKGEEEEEGAEDEEEDDETFRFPCVGCLGGWGWGLVVYGVCACIGSWAHPFLQPPHNPTHTNRTKINPHTYPHTRKHPSSTT